MRATQLIEHLLANEPLAGTRPSEAQPRSQSVFKEAARGIVQILLAEERVAETPVLEASVHRPKRSRIWQAVFTRPAGGQEWRTTGLTNRDQALLVARKFEREARAQRAKLGGTTHKPIWRVRRPASSTGIGLSQKEVALLLGMSERGVREVERRALRKIRSHPLMRQVWQQYLAGELDEDHLVLTQEEIEALFNLARTPEEQRLVRKVLALIHG